MPEDARPTTALLTEYAALAAELRRRGVLGADANEQGIRHGYARRLLATALGGRVEANPAKAYDVVLEGGERVQVQAVAGGRTSTPRLRSWGFDLLAVVRLDDRLRVEQALLVPRGLAQQVAQRDEDGPYVPLSGPRFEDPSVREVTGLLREAAGRA